MCPWSVIPHAVVLNARGEFFYNQSGEVDSELTEEIRNGSISR